MCKKGKVICGTVSVITGLAGLCFIFKNFRSYTAWWLNKIGLWFGTDNLFIKYLIANLLDVAVLIIITVIIIFTIATINKIKRR